MKADVKTATPVEWWLLITMLIFMGSVGYLIAGPVGLFAGLACTVAIDFVGLLGFVPFAGPVIYWFLMWDYVDPFLAHYAAPHTLGPLLLIGTVIGLVYSIVLCVIGTFFVLAWWVDA